LDGPGIAAIIAASGGTLVAIIGAFRIQGSAAKKETAANMTQVEIDRPPLPPVPQTFDGDQILEFLKVQREELVDLRARDAEKDRKIAAQQAQLDDMGNELKAALNINGAFGRWIPVIYRWATGGAQGSFPLPATTDDAMLLRDFIPHG
jgi:hypothetical protein